MGKRSGIKDEVRRGVARPSPCIGTMHHRPGQLAALSSASPPPCSAPFRSSLCLLRLASYLRDRPTANTYLSARLNLSQPSAACSKKNKDRGAAAPRDHRDLPIDRTYAFRLDRQIFVLNNSRICTLNSQRCSYRRNARRFAEIRQLLLQT